MFSNEPLFTVLFRRSVSNHVRNAKSIREFIDNKLKTWNSISQVPPLPICSLTAWMHYMKIAYCTIWHPSTNCEVLHRVAKNMNMNINHRICTYTQLGWNPKNLENKIKYKEITKIKLEDIKFIQNEFHGVSRCRRVAAA